MTVPDPDVSHRCTAARWVSHYTAPVPQWLSNTLPPFPDLYFPVGQSTANPKSLPASPWRRASVEQMASVCRAAIKEGATSGEKKVGQDQGEQGPATRGCLRLGPAHGRTHLRTRGWRGEKHAYTHTRGSLFTPRRTPSRVFPAKTNTRPTPVTKRQHCENEKRSRGDGGRAARAQSAPPNLAHPISSTVRSQRTSRQNYMGKSHDPINGINPLNPI